MRERTSTAQFERKLNQKYMKDFGSLVFLFAACTISTTATDLTTIEHNVIYFHLHITIQVAGGFVRPVENAGFSQTALNCVSVRLNVKRDTSQCVGQTDTCI